MDLYGGIFFVFGNANRTGTQAGPFFLITKIAERIALIGFYRVKICTEIAVISMRMPGGCAGFPAPDTDRMPRDKGFALADVLRIAPPPVHDCIMKID
jgi:hypothetical protein